MWFLISSILVIVAFLTWWIFYKPGNSSNPILNPIPIPPEPTPPDPTPPEPTPPETPQTPLYTAPIPKPPGLPPLTNKDNEKNFQIQVWPLFPFFEQVQLPKSPLWRLCKNSFAIQKYL